MLYRRSVQFAVLIRRVDWDLFYFRRKQVLDADKKDRKPEGKHERYTLSS